MAAALLSAPSPSPSTALQRRRAAATSAISSAFSQLLGTPTRRTIARPSRRSPRRPGHSPCVAMAVDLLGDLGARDPTAEELASNFGEKVVGNPDTEHKILIPNVSVLSLASMTCESIPASRPPLSKTDAEKLLKKVVGWRLVEENGAMKIRCVWKLRGYSCGVELINRIFRAVESTGHFPSLRLEQPNQVIAELYTNSIGGLSRNDFIVAAKIDEVKTLDLLPKKRIWA